MKRTLFLMTLSAALFVFSATSFATNGDQMVGIGAYANAMGGAVTAAPYDGPSTVMNPAGLALIGNRADTNFNVFMPRRTMDFTNAIMGAGEETMGGSNSYLIPAVGFSAPINEAKTLFFGGGMYGIAGMGTDYDVISAPAFGDIDVYTAYQFGKVVPTLAWMVNDQLAVGVALNLDMQSMNLRNGFSNYFGMGAYKINLNRSPMSIGLGGSVGAIYKVNDMISVGAAYISKQYFQDLKYRVGAGDIDLTAAGMGPQPAGTYKMNLDFPQQFSLGVAIRPMEKLLVSLEGRYINYGSVYDVVKLDGPKSAFGGGDFDLNFGWDDMWVWSIGVEYKVNEKLAVRAGFNYGESPIEEEDVLNNLAFPAIVESHASLGATYRLTTNWELGMTYMHAFENTIKGKNDIGPGMSSGAEIEMYQDQVDFNISYLF